MDRETEKGTGTGLSPLISTYRLTMSARIVGSAAVAHPLCIPPTFGAAQRWQNGSQMAVVCVRGGGWRNGAPSIYLRFLAKGLRRTFLRIECP
jgi:hypothetical protein